MTKKLLHVKRTKMLVWCCQTVPNLILNILLTYIFDKLYITLWLDEYGQDYVAKWCLIADMDRVAFIRPRNYVRLLLLLYRNINLAYFQIKFIFFKSDVVLQYHVIHLTNLKWICNNFDLICKHPIRIVNRQHFQIKWSCFNTKKWSLK